MNDNSNLPAAGDPDIDDDTYSTDRAVFGLDDPERELTSSVALFEGDEGGLELAQRKALVVLLKKRFISNHADPQEWKALMATPRLIRSRLNDMFMELHLDTEREVAFKRQVLPEGGGRFPTLMHNTPWGREDTILLVYLRTRARHEQASGADRVYVDRDDMLEFIAAHRPERSTDKSGDASRANNAIDTLSKAGLIKPTGADNGDRYEVSPVIEVLLPMEKLHELLTWLKEQNNPTTDVRFPDLPVEYDPDTTPTHQLTPDATPATVGESEH